MADSVNLQTDVVRQHTVPRFLLKHFSTPGKGKRQRLYAFDKAAGAPMPPRRMMQPSATRSTTSKITRTV